MEFHSTVNGRRYYENHVPRIAVALEKIALELERSNNMKEGRIHFTTLESIADELQPFEPAVARLLREYIR